MIDPIGMLWYWDVASMKHITVTTPKPVVLHSNNTVIGYLLVSVFVYYFAIFKPYSYRGQILTLLAKFCVLTLYVPLLILCGAYIDAGIITLVLVTRFLYVAFYTFKYKSIYFILFNETQLCFSFGKACHVSTLYRRFMVFTGGHQYIDFGYNFLPFIDTDTLSVCVRGRDEYDLNFSRQIELCDGSYLYLFTLEPVVSICNILATTQLNDNVIEL
ncbi:ORF3 protein [Jingmen Miniopterus schreibersii alphacoronavirus 1]|nr:ORF3 protein [Jingmen Miniopterus schreibersii alphacoronavirus 1]WPV62921.1 MAG: ORF3 protein [Jingmen bat alphacoronavirus 2]